MSRRRSISRILLAGVLISATGCASLAGKLRRDFDDRGAYDEAPVSGGAWQERGFLSESMPEGGPYSGRYGAVGHQERSPASDAYGVPPQAAADQSWVSASQADSHRRARLNSDLERTDGAAEDVATYESRPNLAPESKRLYKNGTRATRADFVDDAANEGSLWASDGQTNYYFTKNKIRGVGDIVTITLDEEIIRDFGLEVKRNLTEIERMRELNAARERMRAKLTVAPSAGGADRAPASSAPTAANGQAASAAKPADGEKAPIPGMEIPEPTNADIDVAKALELKAGDTMLAEIVARYPNGNYKIRGTKKVVYRNGNPRVVSVLGVARGNDISEEDLISSGKLYEYRLEAYR
ncbi:MAG: flagellar basal body L-ring protein FlgH [Oligoflexia bacterium]|nr:flagellar basal body L-ring protein FlgH [Oligoflexia bacterium]